MGQATLPSTPEAPRAGFRSGWHGGLLEAAGTPVVWGLGGTSRLRARGRQVGTPSTGSASGQGGAPRARGARARRRAGEGPRRGCLAGRDERARFADTRGGSKRLAPHQGHPPPRGGGGARLWLTSGEAVKGQHPNPETGADQASPTKTPKPPARHSPNVATGRRNPSKRSLPWQPNATQAAWRRQAGVGAGRLVAGCTPHNRRPGAPGPSLFTRKQPRRNNTPTQGGGGARAH